MNKKLEQGILRLATQVVSFGQSPVRNLLAAALELEICKLNLEVFDNSEEEKANWEQAIVKWTKVVQEYASKL